MSDKLVMIKFHKLNNRKYFDNIWMYKDKQEPLFKFNRRSFIIGISDEIEWYDLNKEQDRLRYMKKYWELNEEGELPLILEEEEKDDYKKYIFKIIDNKNIDQNRENCNMNLNDWCDIYYLK